MHKIHHFEIKNANIFWRGDTPSLDPIPLAPTGYITSIFSPTALKLNVSPSPKKTSLSYGSVNKTYRDQLPAIFQHFERKMATSLTSALYNIITQTVGIIKSPIRCRPSWKNNLHQFTA